MKNKFLLFPLTTLVLAACGSNIPAPVVNAQDSGLNSGIMQPVLDTGMSSYSNAGWQTDAQMLPPQPVVPAVTEYIPQPQPVVAAPKPVAVQNTTKVQKPAPKKVSTPKAVSQDFTIPRDEKNAPIYSQIDKGFYNGDSYTVRKGDTMFLIAYIAGKDVREIAALNNLKEPYQLHIGQKLKLNNEQAQAPAAPQPVKQPTVQPKPVEPEVTYTQAPNGTAFGSDGTVTGPVKAGAGTVPPSQPRVTATAGTMPTVTPSVTATTAPARQTNYDKVPSSSIRWQWPTQGRVIANFSSAEGGNKGIDIAGNKGQEVKAAAAGKVVYAGAAISGYGNLIIIKHNEQFLSAYAHNDNIKVSEQDSVKAGETIATLGSTGTNSNKLHFEIRYLGKSVDPMRYLPKR